MEFVIVFIILILIGKILTCFYYLKLSKDWMFNLKEKEVYYNSKKKLNILILIPVLREQNIIRSTLEHFKKLKISNINLIICIAGTIREELEKEKFNHLYSTKEIVNFWINSYNESKEENLYYYYTEAKDTTGDRASQLNYGVKVIAEKFKIDIIGVYDADSLPNEKTIYEVIKYYEEDREIICQQPVNFIEAANRMVIEKKNPILIANALYQTTWTMIRELPHWIQHYKNNNLKRNDYLIGHGEFLSFEIYKKFNFPEREVTDGIQLGYRVSMSNKKIAPLKTFCNDDVPQQIKQLILQHRRWFGGCMRLKSAYTWSKVNNDLKNNNAKFQLIDGYWSQFSWAYSALIIILGLGISINLFIENKAIFLKVLFLLICIYCYLIPYLAHKILPLRLKIRIIDWLCLPIAILLKGVGPNIYLIQSFFSKLTKRKINYSKVER